MLVRFFWEQTSWIFACLLAFIVGIVISLKRNENLMLLLQLAIHILAFLVVFIQICLRKYHFHSFYGYLS